MSELLPLHAEPLASDEALQRIKDASWRAYCERVCVDEAEEGPDDDLLPLGKLLEISRVHRKYNRQFRSEPVVGRGL